MFKNLTSELAKKFNFYKWHPICEVSDFIIEYYELKSKDSESLAWLVLNHLVSEGYVKLDDVLVANHFMIAYGEDLG